MIVRKVSRQLLQRIQELEELRATVGTPEPVEVPEGMPEGEEQPEQATLVSKTKDLEDAVEIIAEVLL